MTTLQGFVVPSFAPKTAGTPTARSTNEDKSQVTVLRTTTDPPFLGAEGNRPDPFELIAAQALDQDLQCSELTVRTEGRTCWSPDIQDVLWTT